MYSFNMLGALPAYAWWLIGVGIFVILITLVFCLFPVRLWFRALISGAHISFGRLIGMKLRRNRPHLIVEAYINAKKAGLSTITIDELETHYMAGGDVIKVTNALISAHSAKIALSSTLAKAIDLAGRDVLAAVKYSVTPRVIETPMISAIAMDGIELKVKARVTVRVNIARLVGGAGEETVIARVGEGVVTTVGSAQSHKEVLANPDEISKTVLRKGLDSGTAFEILSIDIADIDVGRNIGAELQADQAETDKKIAQAKAEEKKAMAIAEEQVMRARTQEAKAQLLLAESDVPKALAEAFRKGNLGVMDYYKMENVVADTSMRKSFSGDNDDKRSRR